MNELSSEQTNNTINKKYDDYFQKTGIKLTNTGESSKLVSNISQKILNIYDKEEILKQGHLLGEYRDIRTILSERTQFHIDEFVAYQTAAAHYELLIGELDNAYLRLKSLKELGQANKLTQSLAHEISLARIENFQKNLEEQQIVTKQIQGFPKVAYPQTTKAPKLHSALQIFYTQSVENIDFEKVQFLYKHRTALIPNLEAMLLDSMHRYDHFKNVDLPTENRSFGLHALFLLGALEAEKSLPKVLDFLRMGEEFTQFWFGTDVDYLLFAPLYSLGKNQLSVLKSFALEENIYTWNKVLISDVVSQVAHHQPKRREEVILWYKEVFTYLLKNAKNEALVDTVFITSAAKAVTKLRAMVLLPLIEALYKKQWIDPNIYGDLKKHKTDIQKPIPASALEPLPTNLEEFYTGEYRDRKAEPELGIEDMLKNQSLLKNPTAKAFMEMYTNDDREFDLEKEEALLNKIKHLPPTTSEE
ncbi:MAG: DUF1186 domain-containing protein [Chitinophagales bacterium]